MQSHGYLVEFFNNGGDFSFEKIMFLDEERAWTYANKKLNDWMVSQENSEEYYLKETSNGYAVMFSGFRVQYAVITDIEIRDYWYYDEDD